MAPTSSAMDNALASHYQDPSLINPCDCQWVWRWPTLKKITRKIS